MLNQFTIYLLSSNISQINCYFLHMIYVTKSPYGCSCLEWKQLNLKSFEFRVIELKGKMLLFMFIFMLMFVIIVAYVNALLKSRYGLQHFMCAHNKLYLCLSSLQLCRVACFNSKSCNPIPQFLVPEKGKGLVLDLLKANRKNFPQLLS